uniref:Transcription factor n=1 Tax=Steinernema glaseri TaxID=37863 RepID=A0A1I8A7Q8_9BILA
MCHLWISHGSLKGDGRVRKTIVKLKLFLLVFPEELQNVAFRKDRHLYIHKGPTPEKPLKDLAGTSRVKEHALPKGSVLTTNAQSTIFINICKIIQFSRSCGEPLIEHNAVGHSPKVQGTTLSSLLLKNLQNLIVILVARFPLVLPSYFYPLSSTLPVSSVQYTLALRVRPG